MFEYQWLGAFFLFVKITLSHSSHRQGFGLYDEVFYVESLTCMALQKKLFADVKELGPLSESC